MFSLAGKAENQAEKGEIYFENALFARTYIPLYFPKKAFTPSHNVRFLLIFIGFECEGLDFKAFTRAVNVTFPDFG